MCIIKIVTVLSVTETVYISTLLLLLLLLLDDVRNDIYVTLEHGQFEKGNKTAPRNVEVAIAVCDTNGLIVPVS